VSLSYAWKHDEAAKRICDAQRAAGIEAWFDQSELRGADAWDLKIREHIRTCALLGSIITAHSRSRLDGHFRRECKLAADRTKDRCA
jgi:hypothetical protein